MAVGPKEKGGWTLAGVCAVQQKIGNPQKVLRSVCTRQHDWDEEEWMDTGRRMHRTAELGSLQKALRGVCTEQRDEDKKREDKRRSRHVRDTIMCP